MDATFIMSDKRRHSFQRHWMGQYSWLVFLDVAKGAFCKVCVLFGRNHDGHGGQERQELRPLVAIPFINSKKAKQIFDSHSKPVRQTIICFQLRKHKGLCQL